MYKKQNKNKNKKKTNRAKAKGPKGRFSTSNKVENHCSKGKERRRRTNEGEERMTRKKSYGFISVSLRFLTEKKKLLGRKDLFSGKDVFKNLARYMLNHRPLL